VKKAFHIEDIEALRLRGGIDDVELREKVGRLAVGDCVRLTILGTTSPGRTLMVRVTRAEGSSFRGRLIQCPAKGPDGLRLGTMLDFQAAHIHSIVRAEAAKKNAH
jgi:hypothetical protein